MNNGGMTLLEVLAALLVLTLLVTAMGTSLDLMGRAENASRFASQSDALAAVLQTTLTDVLGFGEDISEHEGRIVFSNGEYGIEKGELCIEAGKLCVRETGAESGSLTGSGIYGDLLVSDLKIQFIPPDTSGAVTRLDGSVLTDIPGGVFYINFRIETTTGLFRDYETTVRIVNP